MIATKKITISEQTKNCVLFFIISRIPGYPGINLRLLQNDCYQNNLGTNEKSFPLFYNLKDLRLLQNDCYQNNLGTNEESFPLFYKLKNLRLPRNLRLLQNDCYQNNFGTNEKSFLCFL